MNHEINLTGYTASCNAADNMLCLGTAGSYGLEKLHVTADAVWDGLTITATFTNSGSTTVAVSDGAVDVPPEATRLPTRDRVRYGMLAFKGVDANGKLRIISTPIYYKVQASAATDGSNTIDPTPDQYAQFVAEVMAEADRAEAAADRAESAGSTVSPEQIAAAVNNYLTENPVQATPIDATLTQSGQAADAAAVGNRLSALSEEIVTTAESKVSAHNTGTDTHSDIRVLIQGLTDRLNALADSDDTTLDQLSEVVAYIKSNRDLISSITTDKVSVADIVDNLTTNVANKPLSAAQGVALKALIDAISIPEKLPNPNALTFTGAVTGSYDGSAPLTVNIPEGGGGTGGGYSDYEVLIDETITTDEAGISTISYTELDFSKYNDIVICFDREKNATNTGGDRKVTIYMLGYILFLNHSIANPVDSYRSSLFRVLNMGGGNVASFASTANNQYSNPSYLYCCGIYPLNGSYNANYDKGFKMNLNMAYVGTIKLKILAK